MLIKTSFHFPNRTDRFYPFGSTTEKQFNHILEKIKNPPDDTAQRLQRDNCAYCGENHTFSGKGDHILNKEIWEKHIELNSLPFRINCCRSCNSSKGKKDMLEWWIIHKKKSILDLSMDHISIYARAKWQYHKADGTLKEKVPEFWDQVISQIHEHIRQKSYFIIWSKDYSDKFREKQQL